jgi:hypothetical protein
MNSPSQGMSLFGKFKMLEQRVNQLTLNQPNTLDVSLFGSDKLKRLQERIENLSQYDSHMFSVLREENQHHAQDIASLKTTCNELARETQAVKTKCKKFDTDLLSVQHLSRLENGHTLGLVYKQISLLQKSVAMLEGRIARLHHNSPDDSERSHPYYTPKQYIDDGDSSDDPEPEF